MANITAYPTLVFGLACGIAMPAMAQVTTLEANGAYSLGASPTTTLQDTLPTDPVDVLTFPSSGNNNAGLHSYGSSAGSFGSRSSGGGVYNVTGSFLIVQTVTNFGLTPQLATFNFNITPGVISNYIATPLTGAHFLTAGVTFSVLRDGNPIYGSTGTLTSNSGGTNFVSTGDTSLYAGSGPYYSIAGAAKSINLGLVGAGQSFTLSYELTSFASGNTVMGPPGPVTPVTVFVPGQFVDQGQGPVFVPGHNVLIREVAQNGASGSQGSSGDPFDVNFLGQTVFSGTSAGPGAASVVLSAVPEPATWTMLVAGFGLGGAALRRRRAVTPTRAA